MASSHLFRLRCGSATACSAGSALRGSSCRSPPCCGTTRRPPTRRSAKACPGTSAAAPVIRASSTQFTAPRKCKPDYRPLTGLAFELRDDGGDPPGPRFGLLGVEHGSRVLLLVGVGELVPCRSGGGRRIERGL